MDIILVGAKNHPQTNEIIGCIKTRVILIQNIEIAMSIIPRLLLNRNTPPGHHGREGFVHLWDYPSISIFSPDLSSTVK